MRYTLKQAQSALPELKPGDLVAEVKLHDSVDARTFEALVYAGVLAIVDMPTVAKVITKPAATSAPGETAPAAAEAAPPPRKTTRRGSGE